MADVDEGLAKLDSGIDLSGLDSVNATIEEMRANGISGYALDVAAMELSKLEIERANPGWRGVCYLYFGYFGLDGRASFLKVGISNNPEFRLQGSLAVSNPLDLLWAYAVRFDDRRSAGRHERGIHSRLSATRRRGEWFRVDDLDEQSSRHHALGLKRDEMGDEAALFQVGGLR